MHNTVCLTLKVGSNPSHVTPYFILGWNRWNVWFGMKEGSEQLGCILYLTSFSSEYTWVLFNGPNGHWVTPGWPSNTLFKSHNTQAQDFWTTAAKAEGGGGRAGGGGGAHILHTVTIYNKLQAAWFTSLRGLKTAWFTCLRGYVFWQTLSFIELTLHLNDNLLSCLRIWWCESLLFRRKIYHRVLEINPGSITAQSALGGHFVFLKFNFHAFSLKDGQQHTLTQIFYFDSKVWGLLVFAL